MAKAKTKVLPNKTTDIPQQPCMLIDIDIGKIYDAGGNIITSTNAPGVFRDGPFYVYFFSYAERPVVTVSLITLDQKGANWPFETLAPIPVNDTSGSVAVNGSARYVLATIANSVIQIAKNGKKGVHSFNVKSSKPGRPKTEVEIDPYVKILN